MVCLLGLHNNAYRDDGVWAMSNSPAALDWIGYPALLLTRMTREQIEGSLPGATAGFSL